MSDLFAEIERQRRNRADAERRLHEALEDGTYEWEPTYGFISEDRVRLAAAVEVIRRKICLYAGDPCDCKYGIGAKLVDGRPSSEASGCPELRSAVRLLLHGPATPARAAR